MTVGEGYGDEVGDLGGYGTEDDGYGSPFSVEGWHIASILEEGISYSVISEVNPSSYGVGALREDGGELVVLASDSPLESGTYQVYLRPNGTSTLMQAYSGVKGQGDDIYPDEDNNWIVFVSPLSQSLGAVDIILERPSGQTVLLGLLTYVAYSERSGTRLLQSLLPSDWGLGSYDPTV